MIRRAAVLLLLSLLSIIFLLSFSSCGSTANPPVIETNNFLTHMDDLNVINMAANYLKEQGETVSFQETYIEYHEAEVYPAHISLEDGKYVDYSGDFLEIRIYQEDDLKQNTSEHFTVVYISQDGEILGQNRINKELPYKENIKND